MGQWGVKPGTESGGTGRAVPATAAGQAGCRAKARGRAYYKTFCLGFKLEKHPSPLFQAEFSSRLCRAGTSLHPTAQRRAHPAPGRGAEPCGTPGLCMGHPLAWAAVAVRRGLAPAPTPTRQHRRSPLPPSLVSRPQPRAGANTSLPSRKRGSPGGAKNRASAARPARHL